MQIRHDSASNHLHVTTTETSGKLGKIDVSIKGDKSKNERKYFLSEKVLNSDEKTSQHLVCARPDSVQGEPFSFTPFLCRSSL